MIIEEESASKGAGASLSKDNLKKHLKEVEKDRKLSEQWAEDGLVLLRPNQTLAVESNRAVGLGICSRRILSSVAGELGRVSERSRISN